MIDDEFKDIEEYDAYLSQRPAQVMLTCTKDFVDETDVEFVDIEENEVGEDVLTFKCSKCGQEHRSRRYGR